MSEEYKTYEINVRVSLSYPVYVNAKDKESAIKIVKYYGADLVVDLLDQSDMTVYEDRIYETDEYPDFEERMLGDEWK